MKGDVIPDGDHILRYVSAKHIDREDDGNVVILGSGFIARPRDDNYVSYNWLEFFRCGLEESVQRVRDAARIEYKKSARLVRLNVGEVISSIKEGVDYKRAVTVLHDPRDPEQGYDLPDESHCLMGLIPSSDDPEGELIGDVISDCVIDIFPAK